MFPNLPLWIKIVFSAAVAFFISYLMVPPVKRFAERIDAVDKPDDRRVNRIPIPRMGGLAIFMGFMLSLILFVEMSQPVMGVMLGTLIIACMGAVDDIVSLRPWVKLAVQLLAAAVAIRCGVVFRAISNPNFLSDHPPPDRLSLHPADGSVDPRLHQRRQPHRRAGRSRRGRVHDQLADDAGRVAERF